MQKQQRTAVGKKPSSNLSPPTMLDVLMTEHRQTVALLHHAKEQLAGPSPDPLFMEKLLDAVCMDMRLHSAAELSVLYPLFEKKLGKKGKEIAKESREEHSRVENDLLKLLELRKEAESATDELDQLLSETIDVFERHLKEEEEEYMPLLIEKVTEDELTGMVQEFLQAKVNAPLMPQVVEP